MWRTRRKGTERTELGSEGRCGRSRNSSKKQKPSTQRFLLSPEPKTSLVKNFSLYPSLIGQLKKTDILSDILLDISRDIFSRFSAPINTIIDITRFKKSLGGRVENKRVDGGKGRRGWRRREMGSDGEVFFDHDFGFFGAILACYNNHWVLKTSPDDWWNVIVR